MKTQVFKTVLLAVFVSMVVSPATAQDDEYQAMKEIDKSYDVKEGFLLGVDNKYGSINIVNWDKDEVAVQVKIEVKSISKEKAEKVLETVEIDIDESNKEVFFETDYDRKSFPNKTQVKVSYTVNAPKYLNANLEMSYGAIFIQELSGRVIIDSRYSSVDIDGLSNSDQENVNVIDLAYSNLTIGSSEVLVCELAYSPMTIDDAGVLELESKYSQLKIEKAESLIIESKYDKGKVGEIAKVFEIESAYTQVNLGDIGAGIELITAEMAYGNLKGNVAAVDGFKVNAEVSYGSVDVPEGNLSKMKEGQTLTVTGKAGKGGDAIVNVDMRYGSLMLSK